MTSTQDFNEAIGKYSPFVRRLVFHGLVRPLYGLRYSLSVDNSQPVEPGALILANHQSFDDIPLISLAWYREHSRVPRHIMRNNLSSFYLKIGGIPVCRTSELLAHKKDLDRKSQRGFIAQMRVYRGNALEYIADCLSQQQDVCLFPSGTRNCAEIHSEGIQGIFEACNSVSGRPLLLVPLAISYGPKQLRRSAHIKISEPITCTHRTDVLQALDILSDLVRKIS